MGDRVGSSRRGFGKFGGFGFPGKHVGTFLKEVLREVRRLFSLR